MKRLQLDIPLLDKTLPTPTPQVQNHPTGNAFIENNIPLVSPQYDADVKTGRALALGATNDLPIPIHNNGGANSFLTYHDIANDEIIQIGNAVDGGSSKEYVDCSDFSCSDGWALKSSNTTISGGQLIIDTHIDNGWYSNAQQPLDIDLTKTYILEIDVAEIDDVLYVRIGNDINGGVGGGAGISTAGVHTVEYSNRADTNVLTLEDRHSLPCKAVINSISVKEILPTSTEYILNDVTVNNILTHQMPFSEGDLTLIQQEPNLLAALALDELTPISSVTLDADDSWYACSEVSGAEVFDARA